MVSVVLNVLTEGRAADRMLSQYPALNADDVHAARLAGDRTRPLPSLEEGHLIRFKLDENMPVVVAHILRNSGYDSGTSNPAVLDVCRGEHRSLLTLDLDFASLSIIPPPIIRGS